MQDCTSVKSKTNPKFEQLFQIMNFVFIIKRHSMSAKQNLCPKSL